MIVKSHRFFIITLYAKERCQITLANQALRMILPKNFLLNREGTVEKRPRFRKVAFL